MINKIVIPRLSVNDDMVLIGNWIVTDGDRVEEGQSIAEVETMKETTEIITPFSGFIKIIAIEGNEYKVDKVIAFIYDNPSEINSLSLTHDSVKEEEKKDNRQYTSKAKHLLKKHNIDVTVLPTDRIIREKDIEALIASPFQINDSVGNKIFIYGGGDIIKVIIDILHQSCGYRIIGIVNLSYPNVEKDLMGVRIIGNNAILPDLYKSGVTKVINGMVAVNQKELKVRKTVYNLLKQMNFDFPNIIHKSSEIESSVKIGEGNLILAKTIISSNSLIGSNCVINSGAVINHDCIISDHCHITSGAIIGGGVVIGENSIIGQGVTIYHHVKIGKNVIIQNGCNIFSDVSDNSIIKG